MTRKRRNNSSSDSEKSHSSETRRSTSPSTSRSHSSRSHPTNSSNGFTNHCKNSDGRRHAENQKGYSRHHRIHRLNDSKINDEKDNRYMQNDKEKKEKGNDVMDWRHRRSSDDNDVRERSFSDKMLRKGKERMKSQTLERAEENRDSFSKHGLRKKMKKEFDKETDGKLSTSNTKEERFKGVGRDHSSKQIFSSGKFGEYLRGDHDSKEEAKIEKEKPNFEPSGKLAEDTNTYRGVVIKYNEPSDAHLPKLRWRLYPFKGDEALPVLYIHRQSAYLIGRDRKIADLPVDHPSCSKQHAVFQYRLTPKDLPDGTTVNRIRPYIIDLGSANGTYLNNERIESQRFVELREKDVLKFGFSTREFVLLNEKSRDGEDLETLKKEEQSSS
uniref:FHA domain-containing protein n=1 Tax=Elaeophora elaphi TaxID=1147741 RepID=A0A0R3S6N9_9BILA